MKKIKTSIDEISTAELPKKDIIGVFISNYVDVSNHPSGLQQLNGSFLKGTVIFDYDKIVALAKKEAPIEIYEKIDGIYGAAEG